MNTSASISTPSDRRASEDLGLWEPKRALTLDAARAHTKRIKLLRYALMAISAALVCILIWQFLTPSLDSFSANTSYWIAVILARNIVLALLVYGGWHLWLYTWRRQGTAFKYNQKWPKESSVFLFNNQTADNMFWTLASGVTVWSAYEILMMWALANGYAPALSMPGHFLWLVLLIFLLPMWETTHFFLIHRVIHTSKLYQKVHALHHRNTNVGPWSGLSMHPVEHVIYLSTVLIHFVIPSTPLLIVFHLSYFTLSAATTHTGFQGIVHKGKLILPLGTFHHQLHHRYFTCNYGGLETPWDHWTGSFHDGTEESHERFLAKRKG